MFNVAINPNNPIAPSFPRRRESSGLCTPQSGQNFDIDPLRGNDGVSF